MLEVFKNNHRLRVFYFTMLNIARKRSHENLFYNVFGRTATAVARQMVTREVVDGEYLLVYFQGFDHPLFYPLCYPRRWVYGTIREIQPKNWHCYEVPETRVRPDDVVFDLGAAEGLFSYFVAPRARSVHVFEPLPEFLGGLRRTFQSHRNVTLVASGVAEHSSKAWLTKNGNMSEITETPTDTPITIESLDEYCARTGVFPTYVKADIEGCERRMLKGAFETIRRHKPRLAITTYHNSGDAEFIRDIVLRANPEYRLRIKGVSPVGGNPVMLHAW